MAPVNTVSGPVECDQLGVTYMHEHVFVVNPEFQHYWPGYRSWDQEELVETGRTALRKLKEKGVDTLVDVTVAGAGRQIRAMAEAARGTGLNVIAATGWYSYDNLSFMFRPLDLDGRIAELQRLFVRDFEEGMEGTSIKPGVIKCSTDVAGVTPDIEALLRASARTHVQTGLPITTHTSYKNESGLMQQALFQEEGVDMGAVVIGHCNESNDLGYLEKLIENGSYIGFDRLGMASPDATLEDQLDNLAELCRRGYADRVMLSHDHIVYFDMVPVERYRQRYADHPANYPFGYIDNALLPGLRKRDISERDLMTMLVENPKRYFARTGG